MARDGGSAYPPGPGGCQLQALLCSVTRPSTLPSQCPLPPGGGPGPGLAVLAPLLLLWHFLPDLLCPLLSPLFWGITATLLSPSDVRNAHVGVPHIQGPGARGLAPSSRRPSRKATSQALGSQWAFLDPTVLLDILACLSLEGSETLLSPTCPRFPRLPPNL